MNQFTRKMLLALPHRDWQDDTPLYDSLLVLSSRKKHDSGWAAMVIVGCRKQEPVEICTDCTDDIEWVFPAPIVAGDVYQIGQVRTDCLHPAGAVHFWLRQGYQFRVGAAISSVTVRVIPR